LFEKSSRVETHGLRLAKRADFGLVRVLKLLGALPCGPIAPVRLLRRVQGTLYEYRFGLATFLIPLGIRASPEVIVGPFMEMEYVAFNAPNACSGATGLLAMVGRLLGSARVEDSGRT